jgi:hypothetical protein
MVTSGLVGGVHCCDIEMAMTENTPRMAPRIPPGRPVMTDSEMNCCATRRRGADDAAQTDLAGAFHDGEHGGVGDPHPAGEEHDDGQHREYQVDVRLDVVRGSGPGSWCHDVTSRELQPW